MHIGVIFGSRTTEHDVSIASAFAVIRALEKIPWYTVYPIYISREGRWLYYPEFRDLKTFTALQEKLQNEEFFIDFTYQEGTNDMPLPASCGHIIQRRTGGILWKKDDLTIDVVFPVLHGMNGEDGSIQGLCETLGIPYVGPSIACSAIGVNKIIMKDMFRGLGLPIVRHLAFRRGESIDTDMIFDALPLPLFIKPANGGSTIGVSKVDRRDAKELMDAIEVAFYYDHAIVIEEGVHNLKELLCSVMEKDGEVITSLVEAPVTKSGFLTFEEKYLDGGGTMRGVEQKIETPARIPDERTREVQDMSKRIYRAFFSDGGAPRIDYLYDTEADKVYVNEINTIPGALQIPLWEKSGIPPTELVRILVETALRIKKRNATMNTTFQSSIIDHTIQFIRK